MRYLSAVASEQSDNVERMQGGSHLLAVRQKLHWGSNEGTQFNANFVYSCPKLSSPCTAFENIKR